MTKRRKGTFTLATTPPKEVEGYIVGYFGIHKKHGAWRVTHVPTGLAVTMLNAGTLAKAEAKVREAMKLPVNWDREDDKVGDDPGDLIRRGGELGTVMRALGRGKTAFEAIMETAGTRPL